MREYIDVTGKTEDEAIQSALAQLGMDRDDVSVEILERAKAGFLGIGSAPARVRVSYDDGKAEEVKPVEKPAAPKPEKKVEPSAAPKAVPMYAPEVLQKKEPRAAKEESSGRPAREERRERAPRAENVEKLLGQLFVAHGPEAAAYAARHNYEVVVRVHIRGKKIYCSETISPST